MPEETEGECYAGAASLLRGDYGPRGCDDITGESIFGRDMGHRWWWWWVSTWGFPSAWERTRTEDKNISEGIRGWALRLRPSCWCAVFSHLELQTAITQTQRLGLIWNDLIYLLLHIIISHSAVVWGPLAVTLWQQDSNQWENNFLKQGQNALT